MTAVSTAETVAVVRVRRQIRAWQPTAIAVMTYEAVATFSGGRLPTITQIVRSIPDPRARHAATALVGVIVWDHLHAQRVFG